MSTTLETAVTKYLRSDHPAQRTREEYITTLRKWQRWGGGVAIEQLGRSEIRDFLDWVHAEAVTQEGTNPGRTTTQSAFPSARRDVVGMGARFGRCLTAFSESQTATRCRRQALPYQGGDQHPLLRHPQDETPAGLGPNISRRSLLAMRTGRIFQLRSRHEYRLADRAVP